MNPRAFSQALLAAALFGAATPASKWLLDALSPQVLAGLFYLGAAAGIAPLMGRRRSARWGWPSDALNQRRLLGAILFGGVLGPLLLLLGLQHTSAASTAMLLNLETPATALLALVWFREHLGKLAWIANGGLLAAGVLLSLGGGKPGLIGAGLVALATLAWGLDNNLTALIDGITPSECTFWKGLVAGTTNLVIGLSLTPTAWSSAWLWALAIGVLAYGASIVLYIRSAQSIGAARSQMVFATAPFWGIVLAVAFLGEPLSIWQGLALVLICLALVLLFLEQHEHPHVHPVQAHTHGHRHDDGHHNHTHPGLAASVYHTHDHEHELLEHSHPHLPDLHHRHSHAAATEPNEA
jgi:drug/metabolite transporter (DMT)-like permease